MKNKWLRVLVELVYSGILVCGSFLIGYFTEKPVTSLIVLLLTCAIASCSHLFDKK